MSLTILSEIPPDTCYPPELQDFLELIAAHLGPAGAEDGATKILYVQVTQPTGVPVETAWFEPISRVLRIYGSAPGDLTPSWKDITLPAGSVTTALLALGAVTFDKLSADVQALLGVGGAAASLSVVKLEEQLGGGSAQANFFVMADGTVSVTGHNTNLKNGTGYVSGADTSVLPKKAGFSPPFTVIGSPFAAKIYAMASSTFVLMSDGSVYAAGFNGQGQLGIGGSANQAVFVLLNQSYFGDSPVTQLAIGTGAGDYISCYALTASGKVYAWGHNNYGQLGLGSTTNYDIPQEVTSLSNNNVEICSAGAGTGNNTTMKVAAYARKSDGTVYGCGFNASGNLGDGTTVDAHTFQAVGALADVTKIAVCSDGGRISFFAATWDGSNGNLYSCGHNTKGQLGCGDTTNKTTPQLVSGPLGGVQVSQIVPFCSDIEASVYMVLSSGDLYGWGSNLYGQLGLGAGAGTGVQVSPVAIPIIDVASNALFTERVAVGGANGKISAAVMARIFTGFNPVSPKYYVKSAGSNHKGSLGLGHANDTADFSDVLINTFEVTEIGFGANHTAVTLNSCNLLMRLRNGSVLACGFDLTGQLGVDATPASIAVPSAVNF